MGKKKSFAKESLRKSKAREIKSILLSIYEASLKAASPEILLQKNKISISKDPLVVGVGKAAYSMASAFLKNHSLHRVNSGVIVPESLEINGRLSSRINVWQGSHPLPTRKSLQASGSLLNFLGKRKPKQEVIFLLSGGASALLELPISRIALSDLRQTTQLLLDRGATIQETNTVRKHLSKVKGGRLAEWLGPCHCTTLVLSDVEGDRLDVIGSGPTYPDRSTHEEAFEVLRRLKLEDQVPPRVLRFLKEGLRKIHEETPKPGDPLFKDYQWKIIGNFENALEGARKKGESLGLRIQVLPKFLRGEAQKLGGWLARKGKKIKSPTLLIAAGEPTVNVRGKGKGGRCQEVALSFLMAARGNKPMALLAAGTDGIDGPTDAAGAFATNESFEKAIRLGLNPEKSLRENNSYLFFDRLGDLIRTGWTGTNVNDLFLLWIL